MKNISNTGLVSEQEFNIALAGALAECRPHWDNRVYAEKRQMLDGAKVADILIMPDMIEPVTVECAYENTANIDGDAIARLGCHTRETGRQILTSVAVKIPKEVKNLQGINAVANWLKKGLLEYAVYSHGQNNLANKKWSIRYPDGAENKGYIKGNVSDLTTLIELSAMPNETIQNEVEDAVNTVYGQAAYMMRQFDESLQSNIAQHVGQPADEHAMRVTVCVWLNALVLHGQLAEAGVKKKNGELLKSPWIMEDPLHSMLTDEWKAILEVNYHSVFKPAIGALHEMNKRSARVANDIVRSLAKQANRICLLRLNMVGGIGADMFPLLAADRKETAAFYTRPEVAELLSGMAFNLLKEKISIPNKIADFACGTGTLLKAAYRSALRHSIQQSGKPANEFHQHYMENCLFGADIQPIATHLTAAGLAGMAPEIPFKHSNIVCADVRNGQAGSLELIKTTYLGDMFQQIEGPDNRETKFEAPDSVFDLCIMNPPYTSAHGGKKLFDISGLSEKERLDSIKKLSCLMKSSKIYSGKAGMALAFATLADNKLREGGVFAFVLPLSAAAQGSWRRFRKYMLGHYSDVIVVSAPQSFSADTNMREMLICARKISNNGNGKLTIINLRRIPRDFVEAHEISRALRNLKEGDLMIGEHVFATCSIARPQRGDAWGELGAQAHEITTIASQLTNGILWDAGLVEKKEIPIPFKQLYQYVEIGPSHDSIGHPLDGDGRGAFVMRKIRAGDNVNLSFWRADHKNQRQLLCEPTHHGVTVKNREKLAKQMLEKQSTLFISRGLSVASQTIAAAITKDSCMGGRAWAAMLCPKNARAAYCFWFNSIFGLITRWHYGGKQQLGRLQMQIKDIKDFPCPVFTGNSKEAKHARKIANEMFPQLKKLPLQECCMAWQDENRKKIDETVLRMLWADSTQKELQKQILSAQKLRELWCKEMSVHGNKKDAVTALIAANLISK